MKFIILVLLLVGCNKKTVFVDQIVEVEKEVPIEYKFHGNFLIGNQVISMSRDSNDRVDIESSYIYTKNPDNSEGEIRIKASNLVIIGDRILYEETITSNRLESRLPFVLDDDGKKLKSATHIISVYLIHKDKLIINIKLRNDDGAIILNKTFTEE